ncbi:MAG: type secretion-associated protein [Enterovirga sp.]|nr:type secretion-associated protein [Enterovirga sp.]
MRCGLYGKLPAKRDFIAIAAPREFLAVWEPWLQGGISASRMKLGPSWQEAFLRAPIWRFWLGADLCNGAVIGAMMPSVDGVGRYFPLTIFARADQGERLSPPDLDTHDAWLDGAEDLLLSALTEGGNFEALTRDFEALAPPPPSAESPPPEGFFRARDGTVVAPAEPPSFKVMAALRDIDQARLYGGSTYWWTVGGEGFPPQVAMGRRMPDPHLYTGMLTGRFDEAL